MNSTVLDGDRNPTGSHLSRTTPPQPSAANSGNLATRTHVSHHQYSSSPAWMGKSSSHNATGGPNSLSMLTEIYPTPRSLAYSHDSHANANANANGRHIPGTTCGEYPPRTTTSPRAGITGTWRSLQRDDRQLSSSHNVGITPLSLQIPNAVSDLPKISPGTTHYNQVYNYPTSTTLPSIALLRDPTAHRSEHVSKPETALVSEQQSCFCDTLRPMLKDVANAVQELESSVHFKDGGYPNPPSTHDNDPVRRVQWILEHLRQVKRDAEEWPWRDVSAKMAYSHGPSFLGSLKRDAEPAERDDQARKRPRSAAANEGPYPFNTTGRIDTQGSVNTTRKDHTSGYSPDPTDSLPSSAHPRNASPSLAHRTARALPSPASMTFPLSATSSLPTLAAQSLGSPAPSYQAASSHTASTHSATSAHIADLQHQVTLKSLALQTLQSEYASLLQKLQREKVKSQTIEKKTTTATQEVNELSGKNEDLAEQVKHLTSQLETSENKRESERLETQREKDQWSRMLEMSGRLHAKVDAERQRLLGEKETLLLRISHHERELAQRQSQVVTTEASRTLEAATDAQLADSTTASEHHAPSRESDVNASETQMLRRENATLNGRIESFRAALRQIQEQSTTFQHMSGVLQRAADQALRTDYASPHCEGQSALVPVKQCRAELSDDAPRDLSMSGAPTEDRLAQASTSYDATSDSRTATVMATT